MAVNIFNQKVTEFMNDLILAYPEIEQFKSLKAAFSLLKNIDENKPIKYFKSYFLTKYGQRIKERDEQFFIECTDYNTDIRTISTSKCPEYWEDFIEHLKSMWSTMSPENKEVIWNYLAILTLIAEKITI